MTWERRLTWIIVFLVALLLLTCTGLGEAPVAFVGTLFLGWIFYLVRVLPQVHVNLGGVATIVVCLIILIALGHLMARWLWREMRTQSPAHWRLRWTSAIVAIVLLMFVAGIGAVGATHQTVWLARQDKPIFGYQPGRETANRVKCASNLRQIGQAILLYAQGHGNRLPDSLPALLLAADIMPEVLTCPSSNDEKAPGNTPQEQIANFGEHNCSYVYHGAGLRLPLPSDRPILCEPLYNHDDGMNVLFADGSVQWLKPGEAEQAMRALSR